MLISLQDFSHIDFVTATWPGQSRQTSLAVGEQGPGSLLVARFSAKSRLAHHHHLYSLSSPPLAFVLV